MLRWAVVRTYALLTIASTLTACATQLGRKVVNDENTRAPASTKIDAEIFLKELCQRRFKLIEFAYLRDWGVRNGVRIYAAGGTAAGLAHYVKDDLEREAEEKLGETDRFFKSRFGYDYYDVYRSTQDADIVIDVPNADSTEHERIAKALETELSIKFGYLQGSKSVWEVRFLRHDRGKAGEPSHKDALLSPDFTGQNSDSHSTGLVELTESKPDEEARSIVRDVRDWESPHPQFLRDVLAEKIRFYKASGHLGTRRAAAGMNPEILSVIRYYVKAFQYGCTGYPEDEAEIRRIIQKFDPRGNFSTYVQKQIENNGLKLFWHALDVESAWNILEESGLRGKLAHFGDAEKVGTLANWIEKTPLRSFPLGKAPPLPEKGSGRTAQSLGIDVISHETNQMLAYESILRSREGRPNVFTSRVAAVGEAAIYGEGYYNKKGFVGARGTGLTIRSRLNPDAIDGIDFLYVPDLDYVIVRNRNAIRILEESIDVTPVNFFRLAFSQIGVDQSNRGLFEMFSRRVRTDTLSLSKEDAAVISILVDEYLTDLNKRSKIIGHTIGADKYMPLLKWFNSNASLQYPELADRAMNLGMAGANPVRDVILENPAWPIKKEWFDAYLRGAPGKDPQIKFLEIIGSQRRLSHSPEFRDWMRGRLPRISGHSANSFMGHFLVHFSTNTTLTLDRYFTSSELVEMLIQPEYDFWQQERNGPLFVRRVSEAIDSATPEEIRATAKLIEATIGKSMEPKSAWTAWFQSRASAKFPEILGKVEKMAGKLRLPQVLREMVGIALRNPAWPADFEELQKHLKAISNPTACEKETVNLLRTPKWTGSKEAAIWVDSLLRTQDQNYLGPMMKLLTNSPAWNTPERRRILVERNHFLFAPSFFLDARYGSADEVEATLKFVSEKLQAVAADQPVNRMFADFVKIYWSLNLDEKHHEFIRTIAKRPALQVALFQAMFDTHDWRKDQNRVTRVIGGLRLGAPEGTPHGNHLTRAANEYLSGQVAINSRVVTYYRTVPGNHDSPESYIASAVNSVCPRLLAK